MKIIHCADIHLGSKIEAKLPHDKSEIRRREIRDAFRKMVDYAKANGVRAIVLAGDIFDSDRPAKKDKEFFYNVVKDNANIDFLYIRGNHDSRSAYDETLENLIMFGDEWTAVDYGKVKIWGIESTESNCTSMYGELVLARDDINIVTMHGELADNPDYNKIVLKSLKNKNIDYLALGHIHLRSEGTLPERGRYCYSGCLEGRGFDETGIKGFMLLDIDENEGKVNAEFIENSVRTIEEYTIDLTGTLDAFDAATRVKNEIEADGKNLLRINLVGDVTFENDGLESAVTETLAPYYFFVSVKDKTEEATDYSDIRTEMSLRGEFVRLVEERLDLDSDLKKTVLKLGIKALAGKDVAGE